MIENRIKENIFFKKTKQNNRDTKKIKKEDGLTSYQKILQHLNKKYENF